MTERPANETTQISQQAHANTVGTPPCLGIDGGVGCLPSIRRTQTATVILAFIDRNHSERLMQWLHASFGIGVTLGPAIMTAGLALTGRWQPGYQLVSAAQLCLAAAFFAIRRLWEGERHAERPDAAASDALKSANAQSQTAPSPATTTDAPPTGTTASDTSRSLRHREGNSLSDTDAGEERAPAQVDEASIWRSVSHLPSLVGMLLFFVYTGGELGLGLWAYTVLTESRGVDPTIAGIITGSYWASLTVGRIAGGLFGPRIGLQRLVGWAIAAAALAIALVWADIGPAATVVEMAITGFVIAPVFPGLMSDTRNRVDRRHLSSTIGMQIAGAGLGAAAVSDLAGVAADSFGLEAIPVFLLVVFVALLGLFLASHIRRTP